MNRLSEVISLAAKERPIKIRIKSVLIHGSVLPRRSRPEHDAIPTHLKQRFAIVIPSRVQHPERARGLTIAHEVDDVLRSRIDVWEDLVPAADTGTDELLQTRILEGIDPRSETIARRVVPIRNDQIFRNA